MRKKQWGIITMQYYSTVKKNETISFAATWMNLEIPNGSQVRQKEKTNTTVHMETHTSCPNKTVGNEPAAQPTQDLIPSETPRLWGAEHPENRGRGYIPPSYVLRECGQGFPLWGHPSSLRASHSCPELSYCRRRKQGASGV